MKISEKLSNVQIAPNLWGWLGDYTGRRLAIVLMDHLLRHRGQNADVQVGTPVLGQL